MRFYRIALSLSRAPWLALASVAALALTANPARALPVIECAGGFDGFYRPGEWAPVIVTVRNQPSNDPKDPPPRDFHAVLTVPSDSAAAPQGRHVFAREIEVPAFSVQRFYFYARFAESPAVQPVVELRTPSGKLLKTYPLQIQSLAPGATLLLAVSQDLTPLGLPQTRGTDPAIVAKSSPENLPEHWWGYNAVSVVALTRWSDTYLRPAQQEALRQWIHSGGTLMILAGGDPSDWTGGLMNDTLPGMIEGSERLRFGEDGSVSRLRDSAQPVGTGDIVAARLWPSESSQVIAELEGLPVVVRRFLGNGQVVFFAFPFQNLPRSVEARLSNLWRALAPFRPLTGAEFTFLNDLRVHAPVVSKRAARPPNLFLIFILLICYVIAVGPVNFRILTRRRKVEWAWVTVPAIVLVFSLLIYGIGALTKGGRLILHEFTLAQGVAGQSLARTTGLIGVFSPEKQNYEAYPASPNLTLAKSDFWDNRPFFLRRSFSGFQPLNLGAGAAGGGLFDLESSRAVERLENNQQILSQMPLRQWDLGFVQAEGLLDLEGAVECDLTWRTGALSGTIRNQTGRTLRRPLLYYSGMALPLPRDLLPGDSYELSPEESLLPAAERGRSRWGNVEEVARDRLYALRQVKSEKDDHEARGELFLANFRFSPELTSRQFPPGGGEAWLIAFGDRPESEIHFSGEPDILRHSVCYAVRLPLRAAPGFGRLQPWEARREILALSPDGEVYISDAGVLEMRDGACVISATWPFQDPAIRPASLEMNLSFVPGDNQDFYLEILNLSNSAWVPLSLPLSRLDAPELDHFVTPMTGRLFLRLRSVRNESKQTNFLGQLTTKISEIQIAYDINAR